MSPTSIRRHKHYSQCGMGSSSSHTSGGHGAETLRKIARGIRFDRSQGPERAKMIFFDMKSFLVFHRRSLVFHTSVLVSHKNNLVFHERFLVFHKAYWYSKQAPWYSMKLRGIPCKCIDIEAFKYSINNFLVFQKHFLKQLQQDCH